MVQEIATRKNPNLLLHCGAQAVDFEELKRFRIPAATRTWHPIRHDELIGKVQAALDASRLVVESQAHSLSHDGQRYFGLMEMSNHETNRDDYALVLGLRNS